MYIRQAYSGGFSPSGWVPFVWTITEASLDLLAVVIGLFTLFRHPERGSEIALDSVGRGEMWRHACRDVRMCGLK
jgi:hypothetical protein